MQNGNESGYSAHDILKVHYERQRSKREDPKTNYKHVKSKVAGNMISLKKSYIRERTATLKEAESPVNISIKYRAS
jgi:hypothetical protein